MSRDSKTNKDYLYENVPLGLYRVTPGGQILAANSALVKMLKYESFEELSAVDLENETQYHPTYPRQVFRERLEREGEINGFESLWKTKDRSLIYVREHAKVIRGTDGSISYYEGAVEDISEQKKAIERLLGKEKQYRSIIERATDSIIILNEKGKFRYISPAVKDLTGHSVEELYGKDMENFIHPDDLPFLYNSFTKCLEKPGETLSIEYRFKHKDGAWRFIESIALNLVGDNTISGIIFSSRDITERKEREKRLKYIVEIERALAALSATFISLKSDTFEEALVNALKAVGEYACVESGFIRLFGKGENEEKTFTWCVKGFGSHLEKLQTLPVDLTYWLIVKFKKFETIYLSSIHELPDETDNGKEQLLQEGIQSFIAFPLISSGELAGFISFQSVKQVKKWLAEDISLIGMFAQTISNTLEQKLTEETIRKQKEELRLFVDILTHDLKNYHMIASEYLTAGLDNLSTMHDDVIRPFQLSLSGLMLAENVVNDISFLMKEQLPYEYELKPVNVLDAVKKAEKTVLGIYSDKEIRISTVRVSPTVNVLADSLFEQLILNLLTNAVKYDKHDEKEIDIAVNYTNTGKRCFFNITDRGQGIPEKIRKSIFDRFNRFRKSGEGSGLGLHIVKALVERYKGKIWIESRVPGDYKKGTVIKIELNVP